MPSGMPLLKEHHPHRYRRPDRHPLAVQLVVDGRPLVTGGVLPPPRQPWPLYQEVGRPALLLLAGQLFAVAQPAYDVLALGTAKGCKGHPAEKGQHAVHEAAPLLGLHEGRQLLPVAHAA